jgi:hypothetical protein
MKRYKLKNEEADSGHSIKKPKNWHYKVSEADILKISKLMGCLENTIKEIIRTKNRDQEFSGPSEMYFYEMSSRSLVELNSDDELRHYFDLEK